MHQVGDQTRLYYDARSTDHQEKLHQYCCENQKFRRQNVKTAISMLCWSQRMQLDTKVFIISSAFERPEARKIPSQTHLLLLLLLLPCPVIMKCTR